MVSRKRLVVRRKGLLSGAEAWCWTREPKESGDRTQRVGSLIWKAKRKMSGRQSYVWPSTLGLRSLVSWVRLWAVEF